MIKPRERPAFIFSTNQAFTYKNPGNPTQLQLMTIEVSSQQVFILLKADCFIKAAINIFKKEKKC